MPRTTEVLSGNQALVRVLEEAEEHMLPVSELIPKALALAGWTKNAQGQWKHKTLKGSTPDQTLAARAYTGEPFIKVSRGIVRLRTEADPPYERKARTMSLAEAQAAVEKATERLAKAKADLKAIEKAVNEEA